MRRRTDRISAGNANGRCGWLGGPSRITDNRRILNSLPMPAGVEQISIDSHYHTQGDSLLAPPDGWATLATCQTPPELSREGIVDFCRSRLSPEWISCVDTDNVFNPATGERTEEMGNALFWRGSAYVSIDTYGLSVDDRHTFDVYVDGDYDRPPACDEEWSG